MPFYDVWCNACGEEQEIQAKMTDNVSDMKCLCGGSLKKMVRSANFRLKGSGFYSNDKNK